ncbi:MAG: hypothetical protein ACYDBZ_17690 [Steroidobacteraceae bacterium]
MIHPLTWRRRLARTALRFGAALLPAGRLTWAAAMRAEAQHISDDREALHWALGSICACAAERLRVLRVRGPFSTHSLGILWIVIFIVSSAFNVSIALAARLGYQRTASALGWWMREFQYDRFVPFAAAMPPGLFVLMGFVVVLFSVSLYLSVRNHPASFATFCAALAVSLATWLYQLGIPAYLQALSPQHRWRIGICFALTAGVLGALRWGSPVPDSSMRNLDGRRS